MKSLSLLIISILMYGFIDSDLNAQSFTLESDSDSSVYVNSTMNYPTPYGNYYYGNKEQYLILASELQNLGFYSGLITGLEFNVTNVNNCPPLNNYNIKIGQTSINSLTSFDSLNMTDVFNTQSYQPSLGWNSHFFITPFVWDGNSNIIIETCFNNSNYLDDGNASVQYMNTSFQATVQYNNDNINVCSNPNTPNSHYKRPIIKLSTQSPNVDDIATSFFISPQNGNYGSATMPITVRYFNVGSATQLGFTAAYSIDGGNNFITENVTDTLASFSYIDYTFSTTSDMSAEGTYNMLAYASISGDNDNSNDTLYSDIQIFNPLSGTYTIGSDAGKDFNSFGEAVNILTNIGVGGPVTFIVDSGTYNEQFEITNIPGISHSNTVKFTSATANPDVILSQQLDYSNNYLIYLNGTKYITIENFHFQPIGYDYGNIIKMLNFTRNITIQNCIFDGLQIYGDYAEADLISSHDLVKTDSITILNNVFNNGRYGISLHSQDSSRSNPIIIEGNQFDQQYALAIDLDYLGSVEINSNIINSMGVSFNSYKGIFLSYVNGLSSVSKNTINISGQYFSAGIYIDSYQAYYTYSDSLIVANNMVSVNFSDNNGFNNAVRFHNSSNFGFYHNSLFAESMLSDTSNNALYISGYGDNANVINNSIVNMAAGAAYEITLQTYFSDYNNLFSSGSNLARNMQMSFSNLSQLQSFGMIELNSISVNPNYFTNQDLRTHSNDLNNAAAPISAITTDIYGNTRNTSTPDIGAYEYTPPANDIQIIDAYGDYSSCSLTANHQIGIVLANKGSASQSNFNVSYQIDQNPIITETVTNTLAYNDTLIFTFSATADLSIPGPHKIKVYSDLTTDEFRENDTIGGELISLNSKSVPLFVDFNNKTNYTFIENTATESNIYIHDDEGIMGSPAIVLTGKSYNNWSYYGSYQGDIQAFINANQEHKATLETCQISTNSLSGLRMSFNMHQDWTDWYSSVFYVKLNDSIYLKDINGDSIWVENGDYMKPYEFDLSSYIGGDIKISFEAVNKYDEYNSYGGEADAVYLDNINIYEPFPNDVGVVNAGPSHDNNCWTIGGDSLFVAIKNFGSQAQVNIPVHVDIIAPDGQSTYNETYSDTLAPFATDWMHIGSINLLQNGNITSSIYTQLAGDQNISNDTLKSNMNHFGVYEPNFIHTFDDNYHNNNWYLDGFNIDEGDYFNAYSKVLIAESYAPYQQYDSTNLVYLESSIAQLDHQYYPITSNTVLYFDYLFYAPIGSSSTYKAIISVSEDCGNSWDSISVLNSSNAVVYNTESNLAFTPVIVPVSQYAGKSIHLRVNYLYEYSSNVEFGIDNIGLMESISFSLGNDTTICQGDSILLSTGLNPSDYSSIEWFKINPNGNDLLLSSDSTFMALDKGVFYSEVVDNVGLSHFDTININQYDLAQVSFINSDFSLCEGESFTMQIQLQNNGPWTFDVIENGQSNSYSSSISLIDTILSPDTNTLYIINNITNAYGCVSPYSDSLMVNVNPLPVISVSGLNSDYCENDTIQSLVLSHTGGTLSGNGITQSEFDPSIAPIGNNQITYSYTDNNSCSNTMNYTTTVHALPQVGIVTQFDSAYCENHSPINVLSFPSGGILSGDGISGNTFDPSLANLASNQIIYEYTNTNNCSNSDTVNITVNAVNPATITTIFNTSYCTDDSPISLTANPSGGVFTGNAVVGNSFDPSLAMSGANLIVYEYTNASGCKSFDSAYVNVNPQPTVTITSQISDLCENSNPITLNASPTGGTYSGSGAVSGNIFSPDQATIGSNQIFYNYTDLNGCSSSDSISININSIPTVNIGSLNDVCQNSLAITLSGATPSGGIYSGDAVNTNQSKFHPSIANIGLNEVVYQYTDVNGCVNSDTGLLRLIKTPDASFTIPPTICLNDTADIIYTGNASASAIFNWNFNGGNQITGVNSGPYTISWDTAGIKLVELQVSDSSCSSINEVNYINVIQTFAQINAVGGTTLCYGDTTFLFANSGSNYNFQWFKDGSPLVNDTLSFISVAQTGDYSCEITPPNSCSELSNEITVNVNPEIIASFNLQSDACADDMVSINFTGNTGQSAIYNWNFDGGAIASGSGSGPYNIIWDNVGLKTVSLSISENGCLSTIEEELIQIQSTEALITVVGDTVFCDGESVSLYANAGNYTYEWFKDGISLNHTQAFYVADQSGNYSVQVTSLANNCVAESSPVGVTTNTTNFNIAFTANPTNFTIPPFTTNFTNQTPNANSYYWNWNFGDGNTSSLKDPSHTYTFDGTYTVGVIAQNINTSCYDTLSKIDYISCTGGSPNPCNLVAEITAVGNSPICPGDSLLLQATSNPGANYQWLKDGVIINGATNQSYYAKIIGSYQIMVSDTACSQFSTPFVLNHFSTVKPIIASNGAIMPCTNDSMELYVTSFFNSYNWSTGATSQSIYVKTSGDYSISVTDVNSCVTISNDFVVNASLLSTPDICIVGVDSLNHNLVVWERQNNPLIDSFRIYKEGSSANVYNMIHSAHFSEVGLYIDSLSNPMVQSYRYKISAVDTCGSESPKSAYHKTMHLNINAGLNDTWNLIWEGYEGFSFGSYRIYRGTDSTQMQLLTTIPSNISSYTDINPPSGKVFYQMEIEAPHACYPDSVYSKANTNYNSSRSNTVNNLMAPNIGIAEISNNNIKLTVYPNPNNGKFVIDLSSKNYVDGELQILNTVGQLIMTKSIEFSSSYTESFDMKNLSKGVYYIRLLTDNEVLTGKIIIQ